MTIFIDEQQQKEKSKSQIKREAYALTQLGRDLSRLPITLLAKIPLDNELRTAIQNMQSIKSHIALKRQAQLVGKLLRNADNINDIISTFIALGSGYSYYYKLK